MKHIILVASAILVFSNAHAQKSPGLSKADAEIQKEHQKKITSKPPIINALYLDKKTSKENTFKALLSDSLLFFVDVKDPVGVCRVSAKAWVTADRAFDIGQLFMSPTCLRYEGRIPLSMTGGLFRNSSNFKKKEDYEAYKAKLPKPGEKMHGMVLVTNQDDRDTMVPFLIQF